MAAGWGVWKDYARREPPKHVLDAHSMNGPIRRDFQIRWIQGKREDVKERQLVQWISRLTGEKASPDLDFGDLLKDGHLLCKIMNTIQPGSIKRIHSRGEYALRENVANFILACRKYGLREDDCFSSTDLCDRADLSQVASTLFSLAELAHSRDKNFPLP